MKETLINLISNATIATARFQIKQILNKTSIEKIAEHLLNNGVIVPPFKIGDTAYSFMSPVTNLVEEPEIEGWEIKGLAYDGKSFAAMNLDEEFFDVGDDLCLLTREEAESRLKESLEEGIKCT